MYLEITVQQYLANLEFYNLANNYGIALHIK